MDWTREQIAELPRLWAEGLSTSEIGKRLGVSKNAVIGRAHRMRLPSRPSPIRRHKPLAPKQLAEIKLNQSRAAQQRCRARKAAGLPPVARQVARHHHPASVASIAPPPRVVRELVLSTRDKCQNIVGQNGPKPRDAVMCGKAAIEGRPWCPECSAVLTVSLKAKVAA